MRYRVYIYKNILGNEFFAIQQKRGRFSHWRHVSFSTQETFEEATALKEALELGGSTFCIFKPSYQLELIKKHKRRNVEQCIKS